MWVSDVVLDWQIKEEPWPQKTGPHVAFRSSLSQNHSNVLKNPFDSIQIQQWLLQKWRQNIISAPFLICTLWAPRFSSAACKSSAASAPSSAAFRDALLSFTAVGLQFLTLRSAGMSLQFVNMLITVTNQSFTKFLFMF